MGYHVFLVGEDNFKVCVEKGVYGGIQSTGSQASERINSEVVAGFAGIRMGDSAFFYVKNQGVYGLWKIVCEPSMTRHPFGVIPISFIPTECV